MEGLWRHAKGRVPAREPTPDLGGCLGRVCDGRFLASNTERLPLAGVPRRTSTAGDAV